MFSKNCFGTQKENGGALPWAPCSVDCSKASFEVKLFFLGHPNSCQTELLVFLMIFLERQMPYQTTWPVNRSSGRTLLICRGFCADPGAAPCLCGNGREDKPLILLLKPEHGSVSAAGCKHLRAVSCSWGRGKFETGNNPNLRILTNKMQFQ